MLRQLTCLNFKDNLILLLKDALGTLGIEASLDSLSLEIPKDSKFGDISSNASMQFCHIRKVPPMHLAREIVDIIDKKIKGTSLSKKIDKIEIVHPGFINFFITKGFLSDILKEILISKDNFGRPKKINKSKKILLEFVSANPTGPLSIAHARQAAIGSSLSNIFKFLGYNIKKEYYLNDFGNQMRILGLSIELRFRELKGEAVSFPEDGYQGEYVYDIARSILEKNLKALNPEDFVKAGLDYIMDMIKKDLSDFDIKFDNWYSQKKLEESGKIQKAFKELRRKGFIYDLDGAVWFKSTAFGDDKDRVLIKSDGSTTYLSPDIAYHQDKYRRGFNWLINIWGPDHHGYIPRLVASVMAFGKPKESVSILIAQLVTLKHKGEIVSMSTRQAKYVTLRQLLDEVGKDASHFFLISRRVSSHLDFDLELAKKESSENPVYYIQYAHARISSILKKSLDVRIDNKAINSIDFSLLKSEEEIALIKDLFHFPYILDFCTKILDPYPITGYLLGLATCFHRFYDRHKVLTDDPNLTKARLALIFAVKTVLNSGLRLINISVPQEM